MISLAGTLRSEAKDCLRHEAIDIWPSCGQYEL
ncbi:MAG: hypothetical protein QOH70_3546 [Blastocatellia bacterium]|jgi:hypothetical protein|nr:hypothetical protein [Blastocatellia bacterium]